MNPRDAIEEQPTGDAGPGDKPSFVTRWLDRVNARLAHSADADGSSHRRAGSSADTGYDQAVRDAFLSSPPAAIPRPARQPTPEPRPTGEAVIEPAAPASNASVPDPQAWAAPVPAPPPAPVAPAPAPVAPALPPAPLAADLGAGSSTGDPGATDGDPVATEDLMQVPGSVAAAADDFFGGLVRRIERRP